MNAALVAFIRESNVIEGIMRNPTETELAASHDFLALDEISIDAICALQAVFAPEKPIRDMAGMNVSVGGHVAPKGGPKVRISLEGICIMAEHRADPWKTHIAFELLHPFMDGNGRTGRMIWAWMMRKRGRDPFSLSFLHRFYYQTLAAEKLNEALK